jgi:hypothetical protein
MQENRCDTVQPTDATSEVVIAPDSRGAFSSGQFFTIRATRLDDAGTHDVRVATSMRAETDTGSEDARGAC